MIDLFYIREDRTIPPCIKKGGYPAHVICCKYAL